MHSTNLNQTWDKASLDEKNLLHPYEGLLFSKDIVKIGEAFENASSSMRNKVLILNHCIFYSDTQFWKKKIEERRIWTDCALAVNIFAHLFRTCMKNILNLLFSITLVILRSRLYENWLIRVRFYGPSGLWNPVWSQLPWSFNKGKFAILNFIGSELNQVLCSG